MAESDRADKLFEDLKEQLDSRRWGVLLNKLPAGAEVLDGDADLQRLVLVKLMRDGEQLKVGNYHMACVLDDLYSRLIRRSLPLSEDDLELVLSFALRIDIAIGNSLKAVERHVKKHGLSESLGAALRGFRDTLKGYPAMGGQRRGLLERTAELLGEPIEVDLPVDTREPWAARLATDLASVVDPHQSAMASLVGHATGAAGGKPSQKWLKAAAELAAPLPGDLLRSALSVWIAAFDQPREAVGQDYESEFYAPNVWSVADTNADLIKGLIWIASQHADDDLTRVLGRAGLSGQRKIPEQGPRSTKATNAAIWALGQIDSEVAIGQLAILRTKIKNKSVQKQIDKAIEAVAERVGVSPDDVEEMAVPTYGLTEVGKRVEQLGGFTAELVVTGTSSTELRWLKPDGKPQKSVPKAVRDYHADELKAIKAAAKDLQKILPAQRDRIDLVHLKQKSWPFETWAERYLNHPLVGTLARRLIWVFESAGEKQAACWLDGRLVDAGGQAVDLGEDAAVSLWHPIGRGEDEVVAWRRFFEEREIKQPFKQAHREVYLLTDAERTTRVYSNRYASHILKQHQYNALCGVRGWSNSLRLMVDDEYPPTSIDLPEWGLRAEFWVEGVGDDYGVDTNETGTFLHLATDQVRFYAIDAGQVTAHATGGGYAGNRWNQAANAEPLPLEEVPPLVLSEVLRDVDLFVGVASVGNDPAWQDGGREGRYRDYWSDYSFGDLSASAQTRRETLQRLVPRLKIADRCSFEDRFLVVRGDRRTYKIHLGSSNILMAPNDQYLCIVLGRGAGPGDKVFLPFEGDQRLAVILSKAMMLADDTKITDPTILSQIGE